MKRIFPVTLLRLLLIYILFQITRLGFYAFNVSLFPELETGLLLKYMKAGLLFDTSAILYTNALFLISSLFPFPFRYHKYYQRYLKLIFVLFNSVALGANVADFIYYRFTMRRTTADVFDFMAGESNMTTLWLQFFVDYWYALAFFIALVFILWKGWKWIPITLDKPKLTVWYVVRNTLLMVVCSGFILAGLRGGFKHSTRPITVSNAAKYAERPEHAAMVLNTPFCIYRTLGKPIIKALEYFPEDQAIAIFNPVHEADSGSFKKHNVVVIILESFTREVVGFLNKDLGNDYGGYTPFLDSLMNDAVVFSNAYANGRKSLDAIPSVVCGIPAMNVPYVLTPYANSKVNSLASCLGEKEYETAFFHGAPNGSMGFDSFCKTAGFQKYYGLNEYGDKDHYDGMWGIWDEEMLGFMKNKLDEMDKPFLSVLFSLSSHHPFKVPKRYEGTFPKGPLRLYECVGYTDHALKQFFTEAKKTSWFKNTIFVLTADHSTLPYHKEYKTNAGAFSVPIVVYAPELLAPQVIEYNVQQTDIFTTVMHLLNFPDSYVSFGTDMLDAKERHFVLNCLGETFQVIEDNWLLQIDNEETVGLYDLTSDRLMKNNVLNNNPEKKDALLNLYKSVRQQYNKRVMTGSLIIEK